VEGMVALSAAGEEVEVAQSQMSHIEAGSNPSIMKVEDVWQMHWSYNAGIELSEALRLTREVNVPVLTIGIGSDQRPASVRIVDVEAPAKALPGDAFRLRGYVQGFGMPQEFVTVQLASGTTSRDGTFQEEALEGNPQRVQLGTDGEVVPVDFDVTPDKVGEVTYQLQIVASSAADLISNEKQK
jgi:hypothetical protein